MKIGFASYMVHVMSGLVGFGTIVASFDERGAHIEHPGFAVVGVTIILLAALGINRVDGQG